MEVEEEIAQLLVQNGFSSLEEIAYVPKTELLAIDSFDEEIVDELRNRANNKLLSQALTLGMSSPDETLLSMEGMTEKVANQLAEIGILTMEALAESSVDELLDIPGMTQEKAGVLIMKAREPWFTTDGK